MDYEVVLKYLAPCGLDCSRCAECQTGEIKHLAERFLCILGNYKRMVPMKALKFPEFNYYQEFTHILQHFSSAVCGGCRSNENRCPINCHVRSCHKQEKVDFCFQCSKYPCD